jgi:PAS domain-containing protein
LVVPVSPFSSLDAASLGSDPDNAAALLSGVLDSAMDAIVTVDERQEIVLYNRAAEKIFGWPRHEILGQSLDRLIPVSGHPMAPWCSVSAAPE